MSSLLNMSGSVSGSIRLAALVLQTAKSSAKGVKLSNAQQVDITSDISCLVCFLVIWVRVIQSQVIVEVCHYRKDYRRDIIGSQQLVQNFNHKNFK